MRATAPAARPARDGHKLVASKAHETTGEARAPEQAPPPHRAERFAAAMAAHDRRIVCAREAMGPTRHKGVHNPVLRAKGVS